MLPPCNCVSSLTGCVAATPKGRVGSLPTQAGVHLVWVGQYAHRDRVHRRARVFQVQVRRGLGTARPFCHQSIGSCLVHPSWFPLYLLFFVYFCIIYPVHTSFISSSQTIFKTGIYLHLYKCMRYYRTSCMLTPSSVHCLLLHVSVLKMTSLTGTFVLHFLTCILYSTS